MKAKSLFHRIALIPITLTTIVLVACGAPHARETATLEAKPSPTAKSSEIPATSIAPPDCSGAYFIPIAFMPDGNSLLVRADSKFQTLKLDTWKAEPLLDAPPDLMWTALSPDGRLMAWALNDNTIQLAQWPGGKIIKTIAAHTDIISDLKFSPTGDRLFSSSHDTWVKVWDRDGNLLDSFQPTGADDFPSEVLGINISADGKELATIPFNGPVKLWDAVEYKEIAEVGGTGGFDTSDVGFSADGQFLAADLATGLTIWRLSDGSPLRSAINSMAFDFSADGRYLAYSDVAENNDIILAPPDGQRIAHSLKGHKAPVWLLMFSPDGARLISVDDAETRIWQVDEERLLYRACDANK